MFLSAIIPISFKCYLFLLPFYDKNVLENLPAKSILMFSMKMASEPKHVGLYIQCHKECTLFVILFHVTGVHDNNVLQNCC
jgi:hypothetical protein